ncbi:MAG: hypothetical protein Kow00122_04070 [Thermoleophilia bacterium]
MERAALLHTPRSVRMAMHVPADPYFPQRTLVSHRYTLAKVGTPLRVTNQELEAEGFVEAAVTP